jgi:hypothetical protein
VPRSGRPPRLAERRRGGDPVIARRSLGLVAAVGALGVLPAIAAAAESPAVPPGASRHGLLVTPAPLTLLGPQQRTLRVVNRGDQPVDLQINVTNYALSRDGRPLIGPNVGGKLSARTWLRLNPAQLHLDPGQLGNVEVTAAPPRLATPGDHHAIVLVASGAQVVPRRFAIRHRIAVGVLVRVPGPITRRLAIGRLTVRRVGRRDVARVRIRNLGNINERLAKGQVTVQLLRGRRVAATFRPRARSLLPGTAGDVVASRVGHRRGRYTAVVRLRFARPASAGPAVSSTPPSMVRRVRVRL